VVDQPSGVPPVSGAWDEYWRRTCEAAAYKEGGPQDEVLARFWTSFFKDALSRNSALRLLDLACGNGAVTRFALDVVRASERKTPAVVGVDNSFAALKDLGKRFPFVFAVVSDAKRTPFKDGLFDVVVSQFGVEYAGIEAIEEAARLVARDGVLAAILHLKGGAIDRECATNLQAILELQRCGMLPAAKAAFRAGFAAAHQRGSKSEFRRAHSTLAAAAKQVEEILRSYGDGVAGGVVRRLHADIVDMYRQAGAYDPTEIANWVDNMARETEAYAGRMSSMVRAAIDDTGLAEIVRRVSSRGLSVRIREKLEMGVTRREPAAWVLLCDRR
jgi:SAM-dependent methyltransferase